MCALDVVFQMAVTQEGFDARRMRTFEGTSVGVRPQVLLQPRLTIEGLVTVVVGAFQILLSAAEGGGGGRSRGGSVVDLNLLLILALYQLKVVDGIKVVVRIDPHLDGVCAIARLWFEGKFSVATKITRYLMGGRPMAGGGECGGMRRVDFKIFLGSSWLAGVCSQPDM